MSYLKINHEKLSGRDADCLETCLFGALEIRDGRLYVNEKCVLCGACIRRCPAEALEIISGVQTATVDLNAYRGIWVFAEQHNGKLHHVALELIGQARRLADKRQTTLSVVVFGDELDTIETDIACYPIDQIIIASHPNLKHHLCGPYDEILAHLIKQYKPEIVLCGATTNGRSFFPRVAARVYTGLTADCTGLDIDPANGRLLQTRPAFGGNIMATIVCPNHRPQLATVRPKVFIAPIPGEPKRPEIIRVKPPVVLLKSCVELLEFIPEGGCGKSITDADILIAGGRGVGSADGFRLLERLAVLLGGAVAASRSAVDSGWAPYRCQVGQTGKTVQPKVYIACGISGAIQHLVGMQSAEKIIAINSDPNAAIFSVADIGLVGEWKHIAQKIIMNIENRKKVNNS